MDNIIWKRPDGGISVTGGYSPKVLARVQWANENRELLDSKISLLAEKAAQESALGFIEEDIEETTNALRLARIDAQDGLRAGVLPTRDLVDKLDALQTKLAALGVKRLAETKTLAAIEKQLAVVAQIEEVRDTIGLDAHAHEVILQNRGSVPPDHVCVGHGIEVPADRTFREAWVFDGGGVTHDLERARAIRQDQIRALRAPQLQALDGEWMKAMGQGDSAAAAAVEAQRQALRDAPADPAIAAAKTVQALAAALPTCLQESVEVSSRSVA